MRKILLTCIVFVALVSGLFIVWGADFYVIPVPHGAITWSQKLPATERFKLVLDGAAVLDKETGLVWEQSPDTSVGRDWVSAPSYCYQREVGGRKGFRLPTIEELASLVDATQSNPALPSGDPFSNVWTGGNWSATTSASGNSAWGVRFSDGVVKTYPKSTTLREWCVRGGHGYDAY